MSSGEQPITTTGRPQRQTGIAARDQLLAWRLQQSSLFRGDLPLLAPAAGAAIPRLCMRCCPAMGYRGQCTETNTARQPCGPDAQHTTASSSRRAPRRERRPRQHGRALPRAAGPAQRRRASRNPSRRTLRMTRTQTGLQSARPPAHCGSSSPASRRRMNRRVPRRGLLP